MSVAVAEKLYTEEEYLALERAADHKSEYINGRIYAMAGATEPHNLAAGNTYGEFRNQFRGRPCRPYTNDMRVRVSETGLYTYPDVVAVCGEPEFLDEKRDTLLNPTVLVEVLSPSTEAYDRGDKFAHYRRLRSVQEVLLVAQDRVLIEHYVRQGEKWLLTEYNSLGAVIPLESVGVSLRVAEVYDRVEFPAPALIAPVGPPNEP
jgi:Uma2 family endonuclease